MEVKKIEDSNRVAFIMDRGDMLSLLHITGRSPVSKLTEMGVNAKDANKIHKIYGAIHDYFNTH